MATAAVKYEVRYRVLDSGNPWIVREFPATSTTISISGLQRGVSYEGEARAIGANGAASAWVDVSFVMASATLTPIAPTGLTVTGIAEGVALAWSVPSAQIPDAEYVIERAPDVAGSPGTWAELTRVRALQYTDPVTDSVARWYRVRAVNFLGLFSAYTDAVKQGTVSSAATLDGVLTNQFSADYLGNIVAGQLPKTLKFTRRRAGVDVSNTSTWSVVNVTGVVSGTISIDSTGLVTVPSGFQMGLNASFMVRSVRDGLTLESTVALTKVNAPPPATGTGGSTAVNDSTFNSIAGTGMTAISDLMTVRTGSAGRIAFSAPLTTTVDNATPNGIFDVALVWRYRAAGSPTWIDASAEINSDPDAQRAVDLETSTPYVEDGYVACTVTKTGLSASTDYEVQLYARRTSTTPSKTVYFIGTASAVGS